MSLREIELTVPPEAAGVRLDVCLARLIRDASRSYLQKLIKNGEVSVDGEVETVPRATVQGGMTLRLKIAEAESGEPFPEPDENFDYEILYEDACMLVINKPAGLVVHPAAGNPDGTLVNAVLGRYPEMLDEFEGTGGRPGIVHRLDKDTSGCLIVAKTPQAQFALSGFFADRKVSKTYLAVTAGVPRQSSGRIQTLIGRHPVNRQKMAVVDRNGKEAITLYDVERTGLYEDLPVALLKVNILTGRTHQIRVHLSYIETPVLGDHLYGGCKHLHLDRQMLHSWKLKIPHPLTGKIMEFTAPPPMDIRNIFYAMNPTAEWEDAES
ncbi:MAG: RluA family pseudouridine synthase [Victivallaceae bacterium]|nr:RluA family pseudouridine synthase [Victivallaceae bacterium]